MELFKGYVPTKDKKCMMPFKNKRKEELLSYQQVQDMPEYAGILAEDAILVDIDDEEQAEVAMAIVEAQQLDCRVYKTTRGRHFLFKNPGENSCRTHANLACGLQADTKVGSRNSYEVLKFAGKERFIEWEPEEPGRYADLPCWLRPIRAAQPFLDMGAGDGRNQALFNYILTLQGEGYTVEECRETIRIINDHVLPDKLPEDELDKILRDDAFSKPVFFRKGTFLFDKFAKYLVSNEHVRKINGQLHIYEDGVYVSGNRPIEAAMIRCIPDLRKSQRREVLDYLELLAEDAGEEADARLVAFNNGIFDIEDGRLMPFDPSIIITNRIAWDYRPDAYDELTDRTLGKIACGDADIRALLEECAGYCLFRRNELGKAFILTGERNNGKSTYLDMVKTMLGEQNVSALDLKELGDRFSSAMMYGKLANIGDDIGDDFLHGDQVSIFKKIVTGNRIKAERKGQDPFEFEPYLKLLFSANDLPRMRDKTGAVLRRLIIVPFNATFDKAAEDFDPYIKYKLCRREGIEYLLRLGMEGLNRVLSAGFTESETVQEQLEQYAVENNPILLFLDSIDPVEIENEATADVYHRYTVFCAENNFQPMANIAFSKDVNKRLGFRTVDRRIDGRKRRIFVRDGL